MSMLDFYPQLGMGSGLGGFDWTMGSMGSCGLDMPDFSSLFRNMFPQYSSTSSTQETPEKRAKKIEELDKKIEETEKEVKKEKATLEEKETEKKEVEEKKFGFWDGVTSVGKGILGIITDMGSTKDEKGERHFNLGKLALTAGIAVAVVGASFLCPPLGVGLAVAGAGLSALQVGKGISDATHAKTYADKDAATQEIAQGAVGGILSAIGFKGAGALKAAKMTKTAESLTSATQGLTTAANEAATTQAVKATSALGEVLRANPEIADAVTKNSELVSALTVAVKDGNKTNLGTLQTALNNAGIKDADQIAKVTQAVQAGGSTQDAALMHKVETAIKTIGNPKAGLKEKNNATQKLADLLNLTEQDGLSAEVVAELSKVKASPQYGQLLGASGNRAALAARGRMIKGIQNEDDILAALKELTNVSDKDKPAVEEAITILEQLKKTGAGKEQVKTVLGKLISEEVELPGAGMLKADIAETLAELKPTMTDRAISAAEHTKDGIYAIGRGTKKVVTHPFTEPKSFGLNVLSADNFFAQASNQANEAVRQDAQAKALGAMDKGIKDQKDKVGETKNAYRKHLEELAKIYKIEIKNDKTDKKLSEEIAEARETERKENEAKRAKEAAKKEAAQAE